MKDIKYLANLKVMILFKIWITNIFPFSNDVFYAFQIKF